MSVKFSGDNVLSNEMANKTGNISETLFREDEKLMPKQKAQGSYVKAPPYTFTSDPQLPHGFGVELPAYIQQIRMSSYYQNNPESTLMFSGKYGIQEPLGGPINKDLPSGSLAKPGKW